MAEVAPAAYPSRLARRRKSPPTSHLRACDFFGSVPGKSVRMLVECDSLAMMDW
ncbi:hypothetical protein ABIB73_006718, partial [Bradyrhizobium sp. F1.4.3]